MSGNLFLRYEDLRMLMSDIGYGTKVYSDIQHNVRLYALQSDIGRSDIRLSPIPLITDIGLSAHLWLEYLRFLIYSENCPGVHIAMIQGISISEVL
jgi:hypothetical protein